MENENPTNKTGGLKLMSVFMVVLALHVLLIGGVSAWHLVKERFASNPTVAEKTETVNPSASATETTAPALAENPANGTDATPSANASAPAMVTETGATPSIATAPAVTTAGNEAAFNGRLDPQGVPQAVAMSKPNTPAMEAATPAEAKPANLALEANRATVKPAVYTVKPGDTLMRIANKQGVTITSIRKTNGLRSDMLKVGQKLKIVSNNRPATNGAKKEAVLKMTKKTPAALVNQTASPAAAPKATLANASSQRTYTVAKQDTLNKIARQFRTTPGRIMAANGINDPRKLRVGSKLVIPSSKPMTMAPATLNAPAVTQANTQESAD